MPLLAISGAAALTCEVIWMRRLALALGSTGIALTLTLAIYMGGMGLGGIWAGSRRWRRPPLGYGLLELGVACWALAFPWLLGWLGPQGLGASAPWAAALLLLPPAFLLGATLPAVAACLAGGSQVAGLYAVNTAGAVVGVLLGPALLLPALGLRGTELAAAGGAALAGLAALGLVWRWRGSQRGAVPAEARSAPGAGVAPRAVLLAAATAGGAAMALEVVWTRLTALLVGGSVYAMAAVLAVFLAAVALGAALGRHGVERLGWPATRCLSGGLLAMGLLAVGGTLFYPWLPHGLAVAWSSFGEGSLLPAGTVLLVLAMGGAPVASGVVFSAALCLVAGSATRAAGSVLAANTLGGVLGAVLAGLVGLPLLGIQGVVGLAGLLAVLVGAATPLPPGRPLLGRLAAPAALVLALGLLPRWDGPLYAVGLYNRVSEFADLSPRAVDRFAHQGWELLFYEDGRSATVAVGQSQRSGNRWLSINGKVDASTGRDMVTQEVSGWLPVRVAAAAAGRPSGSALVVGLASGVTAGKALEEGVDALTIVELEAAVVRASRYFDQVNGAVLDDPRTELVVGDARAWLARPGPLYDVIISEPSNPWITGVSNLFTREYWQLARARLHDEGVFCQWVQLYALPPEALRSLVASYLDVFPQTWLFETLPGADALLLSAPALPAELPLRPTLGPAQLRAFSAQARRNTDQRPWVEFEAPRWLHRPTGELNRAQLEAAAR